MGEKAAQAQEVTVAQLTELRPARGTRGVDVGREFMRLAIQPGTRRCTLGSARAQNLDGAVPGGLHVHLGFVALRKRSGIASDPEDAVRREVVEHGSEQFIGIGGIDERRLQSSELGGHPGDQISPAVMTDDGDDVATHETGVGQVGCDSAGAFDDPLQPILLAEGAERGGGKGVWERWGATGRARATTRPSRSCWRKVPNAVWATAAAAEVMSCATLF